MKRFLRSSLLLSGLSLQAFLGSCEGREIEWSGRTWSVRTTNGGQQGPGPNIFSDSPESVFVDEQGFLHLKILQRADGKWTGAEIDLTESLGFGTYEWEVASRYDQWATNVVGGIFTYISPESVADQTDGDVGNGVPDTPHEIDIEFTKAWGSSNLYHTTHDPDVQSPSKSYYQALGGDYTTHRFLWEPAKITWNSYNGHVAGVETPPYPIVEQRPGPNNGKPATFVYEGPVVPQDLNEVPIVNFWLFGSDVANAGPSNGQPHEFILKSFTYTPLAPIPGDFDGDRDVDQDDYSVWSNAYGSLAAGLRADANGDGSVDTADYTIWRDAFETSLAIQSVPEPTSLHLALISLCVRRCLLAPRTVAVAAP